jgi:hypothetical protein
MSGCAQMAIGSGLIGNTVRIHSLDGAVVKCVQASASAAAMSGELSLALEHVSVNIIDRSLASGARPSPSAELRIPTQGGSAREIQASLSSSV